MIEGWRLDKRNDPERNKEVDILKKQFYARLSVREAVWCWRVHLAAPEIGATVGVLRDVYFLARQFSQREISADVLNRPLYMADLEPLLVFKPWLNDDRQQYYHRVVDAGGISPPPSRDSLIERTRLLMQAQASEGNLLEVFVRGMTGIGVFSQDHPELLASQQMELLVKEAGKEEI